MLYHYVYHTYTCIGWDDWTDTGVNEHDERVLVLNRKDDHNPFVNHDLSLPLLTHSLTHSLKLTHTHINTHT